MRTSTRPQRRQQPSGPADARPDRTSRRVHSFESYFTLGGRTPVAPGLRLRLDPDYTEERILWGRGYRHVAGVDEVGRGCLAGPVVAAAVILPRGWLPDGLRDSKLLDAPTRERLSLEIRGRAISWAIAEVDAPLIDRINILQATYLVTMLAAARLHVRPDALVLDALCFPELSVAQRMLVDADRLSVSVAAASVIAKVHRDRRMTEYEAIYPGYGFASHKGYTCPEHRAGIDRLGLTPLHRRSFAPCAQPAEADSIPIWTEEGG